MIKNSTQLIAASEADFKMLKEKGKEGEWALHYHGYLDGYAQGVMDARNGWHKLTNEDKPQKGQLVVIRNPIIQLAMIGDKTLSPVIRDGGKWIADKERIFVSVTHWMPIPEITED